MDINYDFGRFGNNYTASTNTLGSTDSEYHALHFLTNSVINTITDNFGNTWYNGLSVSANTILYGRFKTIKLTSSSVVAYKSFDF